MSDLPIDELRATADRVLERAREDEGYKAQLLADPVSTLVAAGLSRSVAEHVVLDEFTEEDADTSGHRPRGGGGYGGCDTITCIVTNCSNIPRTGSAGCPTWSAVG